MSQLNTRKMLAKDEAIEMIQTGPPEQFSSVLRNYLSTQQHVSAQASYR